MATATLSLPTTEAKTRLPRLAFVSDVPVEQSMAGALITYRLLCRYPADQLIVVNGNYALHHPHKRLPDVAWHCINYFPTRLYHTRLHNWLGPVLANSTWLRARQVARQLRDWQAEAVLTIPHMYLWLAAATAARWLGLPLHLIVHDDWPNFTPAPSCFKPSYERTFRKLYREATSRLCVSPEMAEHYHEKYGVRGTVLYPTRGPDSAAARVRWRSRKPGEPLVVAYAGSLWGGGCLEMLQDVATILQQRGGRLDIYNDATQERLVAAGLTATNVRACGFPPLAQAAEQIGATADLLLLPLSFLPHERLNTRINFPSRLADYTSFGLPLLLWAPAEHSAVRWAKEHDGAAEIVTAREAPAIAAALDRLDASEGLRRTLAEKAVAAGRECFEMERGHEVLYGALTGC